MKIRTQFALSTALALAIALAAGVGLWFAKSQAAAAEAERRLAQDMAHHTANLLVLTQEYALHFEERSAQQWQERYSAVQLALKPAAGPERVTMNELRLAAQALPEAFTSLGELADEISESGETEFNLRRKDFLVDRILAESQGLADGAYRWSREAAEAQRAAEARLHTWGGIAFGLTAALLLLQALVVVVKVLRPVMRLQAAAASVEQGELVTLRANARDELGDLKRSFNAMTAALAQRTADLDREMARRQHSEEFVRAITDNLPVLVAYLDREERYQFINAQLQDWMGIPAGAAIGRSVLEVLGPERYAKRRDALARSLRGERVSFEIEHALADRTLHLHNVYIPDVQPDGQVAGIYAISSDVTALKLVQHQLDALARVDALTGLTNRRGLEEKLAQALARRRRQGTGLATLFLDVDHFKQINDRHGHGVGDEVLKELAQRLQAAIRITDTPARLAGDEFVVLVEGLSASHEAALVAQKVVDALRVPMATSAGELQVACSVGVAFVAAGQAAVGGDQLLAAADRALYDAKRAGRACFRLAEWTPDGAQAQFADSDSALVD